MQFCELRIKVNTLEFLVYLKGHYAKLAMTNNVEDIVVFTGLKVLFRSDNSSMFSNSRNAQFTFVEKP